MSRASTPTAPTPAPSAPAEAPATPRPTWQPTITITPPASSSDDEGQPAESASRPRDRMAKIVANQASRMAARSPDDAEDDDSQDDEAAEAPRTTPLGQAAKPPGKPETPDAPELSAREKNAARIRESLKAQAAAREAEQARRAAQTQPAQPPATRQEQSAARVWAEIRRHPQGVVAGMKEQGWSDKDIRAALDDMTNDAIAPGTVRGQVAIEEHQAALQREAERIGRIEQHIVTREQAEYIAREQQQFHSIAQAKDGDEQLYPNASRLSADKLYKFAEYLAGQKQPGSYTLESLMLDVEDELAALAPTPTTPTPSPASTPARTTTTPAAKTKQTPAALPPDLAGESGDRKPKPRTERERTAAILARQQRRAKARERAAER